MSAEHESSYYEIALTNRQVLTIFVVLLTCLVAAFLSGVWIGRSNGAEETLEASVGEPQAGEAKTQLTELNFFTEGQRVKGGDGGGKEPPPAEPAPARPAPEGAAERKAPPPAPAPAPARPPAPPLAAAGGRVIQVFSTPDAAQADKLVRRLGDGGYPAFLVEESLQGGTTYRVRVGPYQQEAKARQVAEELRRQYRLDTWITSQPG